MDVTRFQRGVWTRAGGGVSFDERAVQPSDFTKSRGYAYAEEYAKGPTQFGFDYPNWQGFADHFVMRRAIIAINAKQKCDSNTLLASQIDNYTECGFVSLPSLALPNVRGSVVPGGKYQCTGFSFSDDGDGYSSVTVNYQQYGEWELIQLTQSNKKIPDPKGG